MAEAVASLQTMQGSTWLHVVDHDNTDTPPVFGKPEDWLSGQRDSLAA